MKNDNPKETKTYPNEIIEKAGQYGYKAANLDFLDKIIANFRTTNNINIAIPKHVGISNDEILAFLRDRAPSFNEKWQEFCSIQADSKILNSVAINKLYEIQNLIHQTFNDNEFHSPAMQELAIDESWMVRSTGNEDRVDIANPGGNESVPSDTESLNKSIAVVVASYFGEKSMSQRLQSEDCCT